MTAIPIPGYDREIYTETTEFDPYIYMYAREIQGLSARYIGRYKPLNGMYEVEYVPMGSMDPQRCTKASEAEAFGFLLIIAMVICPGIIDPSNFTSLQPVDPSV